MREALSHFADIGLSYHVLATNQTPILSASRLPYLGPARPSILYTWANNTDSCVCEATKLASYRVNEGEETWHLMMEYRVHAKKHWSW